MTLRAPVSGQIIQRNVNLGDISGAGGTAWFVMADGGQIELYADVAEADFDKMRPGVQAKVTLADESTADGVVRLVSPRVDSQTPARQGAHQPAGAPRTSAPGGYARAKLQRRQLPRHPRGARDSHVR